MSESHDTAQADETAAWLPYGIAAVKVIFLLAVFRYFATPFTDDIFGEELLPLPTWEWTVCSITPGLLIWLARRPVDWATLSTERTILRIALTFYFLYALAFSLFKGGWTLWPAAVAALAGHLGILYLDGRRSNYGE